MKRSKKQPAAKKDQESPALVQEFPHRLAELESELRGYPTLPIHERPLQSVDEPVLSVVGSNQIIRFRLNKKLYAVGHTNVTHAATNHARGVRHIRFYADDQVVLDIEGDYEDQQFGSNFRFQNVDVYTPGLWEAEFLKLTDELHEFKTKRRKAFAKKRLAGYSKRNPLT